MTDLCERTLHHAEVIPLYLIQYHVHVPDPLDCVNRRATDHSGKMFKHGTPTSQDRRPPQTPCSRVVMSSVTRLKEPGPIQTPPHLKHPPPLAECGLILR